MSATRARRCCAVGEANPSTVRRVPSAVLASLPKPCLSRETKNPAATGSALRFREDAPRSFPRLLLPSVTIPPIQVEIPGRLWFAPGNSLGLPHWSPLCIGEGSRSRVFQVGLRGGPGSLDGREPSEASGARIGREIAPGTGSKPAPGAILLEAGGCPRAGAGWRHRLPTHQRSTRIT